MEVGYPGSCPLFKGAHKLEKEKANTYMNIASIWQVNSETSRNFSGTNSFMWKFHTIEINELIYLRLL